MNIEVIEFQTGCRLIVIDGDPRMVQCPGWPVPRRLSGAAYRAACREFGSAA